MKFLFCDGRADEGGEFLLSAVETHYLCRVLRRRRGDEVILIPRGGEEQLTVSIIEIQRSGGRVRVIQSRALPTPRLGGVHLGLGMLKGDRMEWALQKSTELGVTSFTGLQTQHGVRRPRSPDHLAARWRGVAEAACQQSGRCRPPALTVEAKVPPGPLERGAHGLILTLRAGGDEPPTLTEVLGSGLEEEASVRLLVGPEGGFAEEEVQRAVAGGYRPVRLAGHVLRAETAAVAASTLVLAQLGHL